MLTSHHQSPASLLVVQYVWHLVTFEHASRLRTCGYSGAAAGSFQQVPLLRCPLQACKVVHAGHLGLTIQQTCLLLHALRCVQASLYGGLGTAAVLAACTQLSYQQFKEKKPVSQPVTAVSLGVSAAVTAGMLHGCKAIGEHNKLAVAGAVLSTAFTGGRGYTLLGTRPGISSHPAGVHGGWAGRHVLLGQSALAALGWLGGCGDVAGSDWLA